MLLLLPSSNVTMGVNSGNIVFGDENNARRAFYTLGQEIRLPAPKATTEEGMEGDSAEAGSNLACSCSSHLLPAVKPPEAEAVLDKFWRRGPNYDKVTGEGEGIRRRGMGRDGRNGITYPVLIRQATTLDKKDGKAKKSKRLWLQRRAARLPPPPRQDQQEAAPEPAPVVDLRDTLGKIRERKSRKQSARSHPYKRGERGGGGPLPTLLAEDDEKEVEMMDSEEVRTLLALLLMNAATAG
eukprot:747682-Hanusia_phi.AAC.1